MKQSTIWLAVFVAFLGLAVAVGCCSSLLNSSEAQAKEVKLQPLTDAYAKYVATGSDDLKVFETRVNKPDIYTGKEPVKVMLDEKGTVVGYKDIDPKPGIQPKDSVVFKLDAENETQDVIASDRSSRTYRRHSPGLFTSVMMMHMLTSQRRHYGGRYYRSPRPVATPASSYKSNRSVRSGSSGTRRSVGGGFGSGK